MEIATNEIFNANHYFAFFNAIASNLVNGIQYLTEYS